MIYTDVKKEIDRICKSCKELNIGDCYHCTYAYCKKPIEKEIGAKVYYKNNFSKCSKCDHGVKEHPHQNYCGFCGTRLIWV